MIVLLILIIIPIAYAINLLDFLRGGMEAITGKGTAVTVSITVGNDAPNITFVSLDGQSYAPNSGGVRVIEVSFLANDSQGLANIDNDSAKVNISLTDSPEYNYTNSTCTSAYVDVGGAGFLNFSCRIEAQYWWPDASNWIVTVDINDSNNNRELNDSGDWQYTVLDAFNLSDSETLAWGSVTPEDTNQTSTTNLTLENQGNRDSLNITTIIIDLYDSAGEQYIPASNFSVFNNSNVDNIQCESTNQSATVDVGITPIVGANATAQYVLFDNLNRGQGSYENLYYCLFHVPLNVSGETYDTSWAGQWDISVGA